MTRISRRGVLAGAAALAALPRPALAQWRPSEAVRIIIPAAPGGTTDLMGRLLGQHLQVTWGQSTVVENKSGGGGTIAMSDFVRQKPDGHTLMIGNPGPNAVAYSIFRNMTYKPDQLQPFLRRPFCRARATAPTGGRPKPCASSCRRRPAAAPT